MKTSIIFLATLLLFTSCGTLLGGRRDDCQKHKPTTGTRGLRPAPFVADLLLWPPGLIIDFATGAIYKPCKK